MSRNFTVRNMRNISWQSKKHWPPSPIINSKWLTLLPSAAPNFDLCFYTSLKRSKKPNQSGLVGMTGSKLGLFVHISHSEFAWRRLGQCCVELHYGTVKGVIITNFFHWLLCSCARNWVQICHTKQSHNVLRHNTDPVSNLNSKNSQFPNRVFHS